MRTLIKGKCLAAMIAGFGLTFAAVSAHAETLALTSDIRLVTFDEDSSGGTATFGNPSSLLDFTTGTGVFKPFLTIQMDGTEGGFSTDYDGPANMLPLDTKRKHWLNTTFALSEMDLADGFATFYLDINEEKAKEKKLLSLEELRIYVTNSSAPVTLNKDDIGSLAELETYAEDEDNSWTKVYDLLDNMLILDYTMIGKGSGRADLEFKLPVAAFGDADLASRLVLASRFGPTEESGSGFEEWSFKAPEGSIPPVSVPEPATLALLGLGLIGLAAVRRRQV